MDERFVELAGEELRAQPGSKEEEAAISAVVSVSPYVRNLLHDVEVPPSLQRLGRTLVETVWKDAPSAPELVRMATDAMARAAGGDDYSVRCRSALLLVVLGRPGEAEEGVRVALSRQPDWAFAHHVLGLLHGAAGRTQEARGELQFAFEREPFEGGRERIRRALALLGAAT